jgi:ubiquinone/menaquinone biosynthesis C-methylase UbiE
MQANESAQKKVQSTEEINKFWDGFSRYYSMYLEPNSCQGGLNLLNMLKIWEADDALEIGCGSGAILPMIISLKKQKANYIMTDLSEQMLLILQRRIKYYTESISIPREKLYFGEEIFEKREYPDLGISVQRENSEALTFKDSSFDVYLSNMALQLVENPENMLREAYRVLRPGGRIGVSVWGRKELSRFQDIIPEIFKKNNHPLQYDEPARSNFHLNDKEKLIGLFKAAGFEEILIWNQFIPMAMYTKEDFTKRVEDFGLSKKKLESLPKEEAESLKQKVVDDIVNEISENHFPFGMDFMFAMGRKK